MPPRSSSRCGSYFSSASRSRCTDPPARPKRSARYAHTARKHVRVQARAASVRARGVVAPLNNSMELVSADTSAWWGKPIMLWSYCCGDSTFVNDMATRLLTAYFNPPGGVRPATNQELLKWDGLDQARQEEGISSGDSKAAALWAFNDAFK